MLYVQGQAWPASNVPGLFRPTRAQLHSAAVNLADLGNLRPEATPHPWGPAMAFSRHMSGNPQNAADQPAVELADGLLEMYLGGLLTGVLSLENVPYGGSAGGTSIRLSEIIRKSAPFQPGCALPAGCVDVLNSIPVLVHRDPNGAASAVLAVFHPDCMFFPAAAVSAWPSAHSSREVQVRREYEAKLAAQTGVPATNVDLVRCTVNQLLAFCAGGPALDPWARSLQRLKAKLDARFPGGAVTPQLRTLMTLPLRANCQFVAWSGPAIDVPFFRALGI